MAVKRKNEKKAKMQNLIKESKKIKCCYCDARENCRSRVYKEKSEEMGINTYCSITPNKKVRKNNK